MKFTNNPLQGVHIGQGSDKGRKKSNNAILGPDGEVLLERSGYDWSENDQIGYDLLMKSMDYRYYADLMNYENEYNSPVEQAKRMRAAGLNPDLIGTSNFQSSDAGSNASAPSTVLNEGSETARKFSIAKDFFNVLPQAISMYTQMKSSLQQSQMNEIQIAKGVDDLARDEIGTQFTIEDLDSMVSMPQAHLSHYRNDKLRRAIDDKIFRYVGDASNRYVAKGIVYDARRSAESNRQDFLGLLSSYGYSIDDDTFTSVLSEFNDILSSSVKSEKTYNRNYYDSKDGALTASSENAKAEYQNDYLSNKDGEQQANTENQENEKRQKEAENDILAETLAKANKLMKSDDRGDRLKGGLLFLVCYLMQNASYTRSSGPKGPSSSISF